ncbi:MAG: hypothetical protein EAZ30_02620 [Betaproteobacteria bacterium]|nr:MAG: hypothetical protein EAZ30_02620 [Betaproteobacteria bacterium]
MKRRICELCKNGADSAPKPWFSRVMDARRDPVWVAYAIFLVPCAFLNSAGVIVLLDAIQRA